MTVKSSISLSAPQGRFARGLVESGKYTSLSSDLQHELDLLRQNTESEDLEATAMRQLVDRRLSGPKISSADMDIRIEQMIAQKLQSDNAGS